MQGSPATMPDGTTPSQRNRVARAMADMGVVDPNDVVRPDQLAPGGWGTRARQAQPSYGAGIRDGSSYEHPMTVPDPRNDTVREAAYSEAATAMFGPQHGPAFMGRVGSLDEARDKLNDGLMDVYHNAKSGKMNPDLARDVIRYVSELIGL
jgi:hypothetical protein